MSAAQHFIVAAWFATAAATRLAGPPADPNRG
jgi:hypothetical protein